MDFYEVVEQRRSIRGYRRESIPDEVIQRIAVAVNLAPSACNRQPWEFRFIFNQELREAVCDAINRPWPWLRQAPCLVIAIGNYQDCWKRVEGDPATDIDVSIAMEHLVLAAAAERLGTCWVCAYERKSVDAVLGLSAPWGSVAVSPLGFPDAPPTPLVRKDISTTIKIIK